MDFLEKGPFCSFLSDFRGRGQQRKKKSDVSYFLLSSPPLKKETATDHEPATQSVL